MTEANNNVKMLTKMNITDRERLSYSLGALMYTPAHNSKAADFLINKKYPDLRSIAFCLEDAIADGTEEAAIMQLEETFSELGNAIDSGLINADELPYIFVRVKYPEQMYRVAEISGIFLTGFIFPKYDMNNAQKFLEVLSKINVSADNIIYGMPILESSSVSDVRHRTEILSEIKELTDRYKKFIINIRTGGNDFCNKFGVRRNVTDSIYDIRVIADIISDIVNIFAADYVVSAPVWEYFESDSGSDEWKNGLIRETQMDMLNGLFGKTAIHPSQLSVINREMTVSEDDYLDALSILKWDDDNLAVSKSTGGNRMNEQKVHVNWAVKILIRAAVYGVR